MLVLGNIISDVLSPLIDVEQFVLERLHDIGLGWGLAIIVLTILVRLCTVPLVVKSFRSQRELREHMPEMKKLQEKYKDDRQKLTQEMQAYYREHGVNPLASLAPLLIQIPIFISLYYLMRHDAQEGLFGNDGFLIIGDLTEKPAGGELVALIGIYLLFQVSSSLIATRAMKGAQKGLMLALPLFFVIIVPRFPAGLAIYWITTSLWTLGQQIVMWRLQPDVAPTSLTSAMSMESGGAMSPDDPGLAPKEEKKPRAKPKPAAANGNGNGNGAGAKANGAAGRKPPPAKRKKKKSHGRRR